jgi:hypothetical protein
MADVHPTLLALLDLVQQQVPTIGRHVLEATTHALQTDARHYRLQDAWARRRKRFLLEFESELGPKLARMRQGELVPKPRPAMAFEGLGLVDEHQALQDVAVNHVVELVTEASRAELFQLSNFFTALDQGRSRGRNTNALRPALFARALVVALTGSDLSPEGHFALVRLAAPGLVEALYPLYRQLALQLREADLAPMVLTRPGAPSPRRPPSPDSVRGGLVTPLAELQDRALGTPGLAPALQPLADREGLLERLYERMLADPALAPPVKAQLARLQVAVASLSRIDPSLLRRNDHPTWRLINAVAAYASGLSETEDVRLPEFLQFLTQQTQRLVDAAQPSTEQFERVQRELDAFIARQARERSQPSAAALAMLDREKQRPVWLQALREQLEHQLDTNGTVGRATRRFLLGPWAETVAQAMVQAGPDSATAQRLMDLVEDILQSLRPRMHRAEREQLRQSLPLLVAQLEAALAPVELHEARRKALIGELMQLQGRALSGRGAPGDAARAPEPPNEAAISRFVEERDSEFASVWASAEVDRGELPTQPLPLPEEPPELQFAQAQRWLDQLRVGGWFHLCLADSWLTAQLVWISADHQYFVFIAQDTVEQRHTLTAGALLRLYLNGLAMYLEEEGLMERALSTLMQDLDA